MGTLLRWLEELPVAVAIAESQSIWGFSFILVLHTLGIALTAGSTTVISLRILGLAGSLPLSSLRVFGTLLRIGLAINALSGSLLFIMAATTTGAKPIYYAKLLFLVLALVVFRPISALLHDVGVAGDTDIPQRVKAMALLSLFLWTGVITTGRLIAYVG